VEELPRDAVNGDGSPLSAQMDVTVSIPEEQAP